MEKKASLNAVIVQLKAMAETSCLRILALLYHGDFTVSDFAFILDQSQSCVSRHLHLLCEAQLIERCQEEKQVYFKLSRGHLDNGIVMAVISALPEHDLVLAHDLERLLEVKKQYRKKEEKYFSKNIAQWDALRLSSIADHIVESALCQIIGDKPFETMLDIGIGTGSSLKLFSDLYRHAVEITLDSNVLHLSVGDTIFDLVIFHWVLNFLENPQKALNDIVAVLRPQGRLLIVDFVCHEIKSSYFHHYHMHFGFSDLQIEQWLTNSGLILEQTVCLFPMQNENNKGLKVKIWLARDPRLLVDDIKNKVVEFV
ncbi:ArsR/SmtB family transcription factor [Bartonella doshiae]|uniref:Ubiquinone/menaquinone biosynthesis methyltransferase n=2 Tax=Bartonella doshiae TaxID=33044 RepID=A0A380ZFB2_BARDO|nr:methyltransferase domain-containing protein [Bartonella doshiae]EJF81062.1 hypothetical protein MCS_00775 [Bartonella doshiae NCTC 12862 = ATCC 700133]MBB6159228.1 ArsR family transcriptional regulator [Bartonella doshiae]SUV45210.1 ubiquinone/menaquinone biosynthesis methyltransferase [Bartonella doshiae]